MAMHLLAVLIVCFATFTSGVYVDPGNPYKEGSLPTAQFILEELNDHSPLHTVVHTPIVPGDYAVAFFVSGLDGLIPAEMYQDYLSDVTRHGFIVVGVDYIWPASKELDKRMGMSSEEERLGFITDKMIAELNWLKGGNLQHHLDTNVPNVTCNFTHLGLFSHSAGADAILKMAERNHTRYQGVVFYEPMSFSLVQHINFTLPTLVIGTEFSSEHFPPCIIKGYGYNHFYDFWSPPKILMNVKGYGHCDIVDEGIRDECTKSKICLGGNSSSIPEYRLFGQGVTSAFFSATLQNNSVDFDYVTKQNNIPLALLEFKVNMTSV